MALKLIHAHDRDSHITFDEPSHTYSIDGTSKGVISVTKFLHCFFGDFDADKVIENMKKGPKWASSKYFGMEDAEIKRQWDQNGLEARTAGTAMHLAIENFLDPTTGYSKVDTPEWTYFKQFWDKFSPDLEPYRLEWPVWALEYKLAGSIDGVFRRKSDGAFFIYDWKRSKEIKTENRFEFGKGPLSHIPDTNYWQYSLQLNIYRHILETYYGLSIAGMFLVILHPDNETYKRMKVHRLEGEVEDMMDARLRAVKTGKGLISF